MSNKLKLDEWEVKLNNIGIDGTLSQYKLIFQECPDKLSEIAMWLDDFIQGFNDNPLLSPPYN